MAGHPWTEADDATLRKLHGEGRSLHSIHLETGLAKSTISRAATRLGLSWDRSRTAKATEAVVIDNRARRQAIVARMYGRIEKIQDRLEKPEFKTLVSAGKDGDTVEVLDFVPTVDERNLADTLSRYVVAATKLEAVDASTEPTEAKDLLSSLGSKLGLSDAA